jgi:hypothetical protein
MLKRRVYLAGTVLVLLSAASCGHDSSTTDVPLDVSGTWVTSASIGQYSAIRAQISESSSGGSISGFWSATSTVGCGGGAASCPASGPVTGFHQGSDVSLTFVSGGMTFQGTIVSSTRMTGTLYGTSSSTSATFDR